MKRKKRLIRKMRKNSDAKVERIAEKLAEILEMKEKRKKSKTENLTMIEDDW